MTDAYGGRGGIAQHNRHLLAALASAPGVDRVTALPRIVLDPTETAPAELDWRPDIAGSKLRYVAAAIGEARRSRPVVVVCGHLHLLPLAALAARAAGGARLVAVAHGIEAWPDPGAARRALVRRVDTLVSVSRFTLRRVERWAGP
ncbi:MAG TPA: glycosyltransferase, partial [Rubricoccaceae bacterium]